MISYEEDGAVPSDSGITTREVFIDTTPAVHRHLDGAGMLTLDGFIALRREMELDEYERRAIK